MPLIKRPKQEATVPHEEFFVSVEKDFIDTFESASRTINNYVDQQPDGTEITRLEKVFKERLRTTLVNYLNTFKKETGVSYDMQTEAYLRKHSPKERLTAKQKQLQALKEKSEGIQDTLSKIPSFETEQREKKEAALRRIEKQIVKLDPTYTISPTAAYPVNQTS